MSYSANDTGICHRCKREFSENNLYLTPFWYSDEATFVCEECKIVIKKEGPISKKALTQVDE